MTSLKNKITLAKKIIDTAKSEINKENEENLKARAKTLLKEIQEAQKTVTLLERQLNNFIKEIELN